MKKFSLLFLFICLVSINVLGQVTSVVASGEWNTPGTWSTNAVPTSSDNVIINNNHSITLTTTAGTCASLTMNAGSTLTLNGALGLPGTSRTLDVTSTIIYNGSQTSIAAPVTYGNLIWSAGAGAPGAAITVAGNLTITAGTVRGLNAASGSVTHTVSGNVSISGAGRISGVNQTSATSGVCTWNIGGNVSMADGSTARIILLESAGPHTGSSTFNIDGNLTVGTGSTVQFRSSSTGNTSPANGTVKIKGNVKVNNTGTISTGSNSTTILGGPAFIINMNGTSAQTWSGTFPSITGTGQYANVIIDNSAGVGLISTATFAGNGTLTLTNGKLTTSTTNLLTLASTITYSGGSSSSFVEGPLARSLATTTQTTLSYPIGKGSAFRPVQLTVSQDAAGSTSYSAEIKETPPTNILPYGLDGVSSARYVHIVRVTGTSNVLTGTINLSYSTDEGIDVSNKDNIRIAKNDGLGNWVNLGGSGTLDNTGTILSNAFGTSTALGTLSTNDFIIAHRDPTATASQPTITTNAITYSSTTFATSGGVISNDGNAAINAKGVCWNLTGNPTTLDNNTSDGTSSASYTSSITGLTAGQTYHVRAYATNVAGTAYGNDVVFTTLSSLSTPTIVTNAVTNISNTSATGSGTISLWGGSTITDRGICWSTSHNPTLGTALDFNSVGAGGEGTFTPPIGGLSLGTTYYVCAYATNSSGTSYGSEVSFNTPAPQPDVYKVVRQGGTPGVSCDYATITDAFNGVTPNYTGHWFIYVGEGTYYEKPLLAAGKINVVLIGQNRDRTILIYDDYVGNNRTTNGVTCVGTSTSYSVAIDAQDFQAQNITFQNTYNGYANQRSPSNEQAVALRVNGDRQSYYNCKMLGYQDTYYTWGGSSPDRLYHYNCYIEGSVDYIFGRDVALFDNCTIYSNRQGGAITAASTEPGYSYGYVFLNSILGSPASGDMGADSRPMTTFYLGRPWSAAPKTVFINCYEPATVNTAGWTTMSTTPNLYAEYGCTGPGAPGGTSGALNPRPVLSAAWPDANQPTFITSEQAATYTIANIFSKYNHPTGTTYSANWTPSLITYDEAKFDFPLPVELSTFTAVSNGRNVELKWSTSTEKNSSAFEVEKKQASTDTWQKIGSVKAADLSNSPKSYNYTDKNAATGKYNYRLKMVDNDGTFNYSKVVNVDISAPTEFELSQNYPNPFNPSTRISYSLPFESNVKLIVYNSLGETVKEMVNSFQAGGYYELTFDSKNLSSGIYFYTISAVSKDGLHNFTSTKKMMLLK